MLFSREYLILWITELPFSLIQGCEGSQCTKTIEVLTRAVDSGKTIQQNADYLNQFKEMNSPAGGRKHCDAGLVLPFVCLTGSPKQSRNCCKNGGTCILGSFCEPHFIDRSCEYHERVGSCGIIPHGEWVQKGCSYCRCGFGVLHCFPRVFHEDCDQEVLTTVSSTSVS
uniref:Cryptic/Cripto CFC domain-containing protein n=1 Tax=Oncorhynchus tshawytscha TaxID=74940 RepID=A0A8C8K272_ONCTS